MIPSFWATDSADNATQSASNITLNAQDEKAAAILQASKSATISVVLFRTSTVTTGSDIDVRIETVSATDGNPTGTLWGTNTNVVVTVADTDDNVWKTATLTAGAVVAQGDLFAVVLHATSAAPNLLINGLTEFDAGLPYTTSQDAAVWTKRGEVLVMVIKFSDNTYQSIHYFGLAPQANGISFNSGSNPDEIGNKITLPFPCRVVGFWAWCSINENATVLLYDSSSNVLTSRLFDANQTTEGVDDSIIGFFPDAITLTANTVYRLTFRPETTTNIVLDESRFPDADSMGELPFGANIIRTDRTDAGAWTDTTTMRILMGLLVDQLDDGAGGSSGAYGGPSRIIGG